MATARRYAPARRRHRGHRTAPRAVPVAAVVLARRGVPRAERDVADISPVSRPAAARAVGAAGVSAGAEGAVRRVRIVGVRPATAPAPARVRGRRADGDPRAAYP